MGVFTLCSVNVPSLQGQKKMSKLIGDEWKPGKWRKYYYNPAHRDIAFLWCIPIAIGIGLIVATCYVQ